MPFMLPPPTPSPAEIQAPSEPKKAENALLEAYDWGHPLPPAPKLKGPAALDHRWLRAAATFDPHRGAPSSPFATGEKKREAEALHRLLKSPKAQIGEALKALTLRQSGTALALWRWGQAQVRVGAFDAPLRRAWEDRLLAQGLPLTRGYALRHALCWTLAEQDEARFAAIRSRAPEEAEDTVKGFQRLFGLLGGTSPELRLWSLPGLDYRDLHLDQLGATRIWIRPVEKGPLPDLPPDTAWIIPSATGEVEAREASLPEGTLREGRSLSGRLSSAGRSAHFAPSRAAFEPYGLMWFPILIELDAKGNVASIWMGDAAPGKP